MSIFADASRDARAYAELNMVSQVTITRPGAPEASTGHDMAATATTGVYRGKARIYSTSGAQWGDWGDDVQAAQSTYVSIPLEVAGAVANPVIDDIVEVTAHLDPLLVGRFFRVVDVEQAGQIPAVRRMQVTGIEQQGTWDDPNAPDIPADWL